jgi:hypothetical protein
MRPAIHLALIALASCALSACSPNEAPHEVSWYLANREAIDPKITWCKDSADRERMADCQNAHEAKRRSMLGSQKDLPPIDWNAASAAH